MPLVVSEMTGFLGNLRHHIMTAEQERLFHGP